jgi:hypothetical protein
MTALPDRLVSIDAECNGLHGRAFAVALTLSDSNSERDNRVLRCGIGEATVDPWVAENVMPAIADIDVNCPGGYPQMLAEIHATIAEWGGKETPMIGHVVWPVEARLLLDVYSGMGVWDGPFPLLDVASVLYAHGFDPTSVDTYLADHGIEVPPGSPHHPLYDARAAERCLRHLMTEAGR